MSLAPYVRILGRGPGRSRALTQAEAGEAMALIMQGEAEPEAIGALLMLLRMKGETAEEIAGFISGAQSQLPSLPPPDLDWSSYAAGRTRGLPWFLLSARLVALAGHRVLLHGWNAHVGAVRGGLQAAGVPVAVGIDEVGPLLSRQNLAYLPLETVAPKLLALLKLREAFGLRSCMNTVARMLNPGQAEACVQGVFHPSYRLLQADAGALMGLRALTVIKGGGGEFERNPAKPIEAFGLRGGAAWESVYPSLLSATRRMDDGETDPARLAELWVGERVDPFATALVIGTAAIALDTLGVETPEARAQDLWKNRPMTVEA
ncbi:Anthranilate phosphoribosyltransferase [Poseidonocella pacifica]|uniref:Anthranilate phosphoribosyltransferase n=1 Tax=Poseidonocella pacifica TaxID=871651 RepID=A0A1I0V5R0_9RHOB|nr:glycosyl transferase family protein [Poseidonocella pacifica]SFA71592.1 Anthranilate phosphoribosyltransferase [Poseidonocella pacifica]